MTAHRSSRCTTPPPPSHAHAPPVTPRVVPRSRRLQSRRASISKPTFPNPNLALYVRRRHCDAERYVGNLQLSRVQLPRSFFQLLETRLWGGQGNEKKTRAARRLRMRIRTRPQTCAPMSVIKLQCLTLSIGQAADKSPSSLQSTLAHLHRDGTSTQSMHEHLQGEFYRLAKLQPRIEHLQSESFCALIVHY